MRRITVEWDENAVEHLWRDRVEPEEVEEILQGRYLFRRGRGGTYYLFGRSGSGRYLFVVLSRKTKNHYRVATARDTTSLERRWFREKVK